MKDTEEKRLKKQREKLNNNLFNKASLGKLTLTEDNENEKDESRIRKIKMIRKQRIVILFILALFLGTVLFLKYRGEKWFGVAESYEEVSYYEIPELLTGDNKQLSDKLMMHIEKNNEANRIYNSAVKQYIDENQVDPNCIKNLENINELEYDICFSDFNTLFKEIRDKQIYMLCSLQNNARSITEINAMMEEIKNLDKLYRESLIWTLECELDKCQCSQVENFQ